MQGLAWALAMGLAGSAAAQEAPGTTQAAAGPWMVFFDWGKPDVRGDDQAALDQVAAAYRDRPGAQFEIAGHTDRSGSAAVNRAAGLQRARTVRAELERRGIPGNVISIASFGELQPLVATEEGVREVQNRRVVITIEE